jgi:hypothetical protein
MKAAHSRFLSWAALLFVVSAISTYGAQVASPGQQENATYGFKIAGTVVNAVSGAPLARAKVTIADTRNRTHLIATQSDESGHFEFPSLPAGKYSLQGSRAGYLLSSYEQHEQFSTAIVTGAEFQTDNLVLRLVPMAMISGHVLDESGEPVRGASVRVFMEDHSGGLKRVTAAGGASTDDRGYFDVGVLRPGTYFVAVQGSPWYAVHPMGPVGDSGQGVPPAFDVVYPMTYYGGATDSDAAAPIELKAGEHQDVDVRLTPVPALHLILPASDSNGYTDSFRMPMLSKQVFGSAENIPFGTVVPDGAGNMEIIGVPPGRYELRMSGAGADSQPNEVQQFGEVDLERSGQELTTTHGETLGQLKVTLRVTEDQPLPRQYGVALRDAKGTVVAWESGTPSGEVHFELLRPGNYDIVVQSPEFQFVVRRTISAAGASTVGHTVNVVSGTPLEVTAELAIGKVQVEGIAEKDGKPVGGVMIALVPSDPETHVEWFRRDQSDFDGTFSLRGVVPGSYTVVAVQDAWGLDWMKPGLLAQYVKHGQPVQVSEKQRGLVHLPDPVQVQAGAAAR